MEMFWFRVSRKKSNESLGSLNSVKSSSSETVLLSFEIVKTSLKPIIHYIVLEKMTHLESANVFRYLELHSLPNMAQFMKSGYVC